jgi:histidinol-phosphatase
VVRIVPTPLDLERVLDVARRSVQAAATVSLRRFETSLAVETKGDGSPVTIADREAEAAILETIRASFPDHAVLAEESGAAGSPALGRWIVDPIDGTRGFTRGGTFWGPLVAYEREGEVLAGAIALPALGRTYWAARGLGAFRDGVRLRIREESDLARATLSLGEMRGLLAPPHGSAVLEMIRGAGSTRCHGDVAGASLLLDGQADLWLEAGVKPWDLAPHAVLVEEAGGRFTDFEGRRTPHSGNAVAGGAALHDAALRSLRPPAAPR